MQSSFYCPTYENFMTDLNSSINFMQLQEVKMRMEADVHNLTALAEENGHLRAQLDSQTRDIRALEAKVKFLILHPL